MLKEAIYHKIDSEYAYPVSKDEFFVKIRAKRNDCQNIRLIYLDKYKYMRGIKEFFYVDMDKKASDELFDYYEVVVKVDMISISYLFELKDENSTVYYSNYRFCDEIPEEQGKFFLMPYLCEKDIFVIPEWAKKSIVYQIFVERFYNSKEGIQPKWYDKVENNTFIGGDIEGITQKLPYLQELGINTIYLTPIFESSSNHKYNIFDYYKIDENFGTLETVKEFVKQAHSKDIKVIFDAVFNHSGHKFFAFNDVLENGEKSKYANWFDIKSFPVKFESPPNYATFGYTKWMPKLMTQNEEVADYLIDVAVYWVKEVDIDGWRLDVANEIDHHFWRKFRQALKKVKEDVLIIGEVWHDSSSWLEGDQYDTVMNYIFNDMINDFIIYEKKPSEFSNMIGFTRGIYREAAQSVLWNIIGSHDTQRFLFHAKEDVRKLKLAAAIQLTFSGTPMIYYGDEVGMTGGKDPDCRRGMYWDEKQNKDVLDFYKKLISIRKENSEFTMGDFKVILTDDENDIFGFRREYLGNLCDVYINNSEKEVKIKIEKQYKELLTDKIYEEFVILNAKSVVVLKNKK